jgi:TP901-1 family phage major tail protein
MTAQAGNLFKIAINTGSGSTYTNFASARSNDWTISNTQVDVTNQSSAGWTTLLQGAGTQKMAISVQGVVQEGAEEAFLVTSTFGNAIVPLKFTNGFGDTFIGSFAISSYKRSGTYNGEEQFTASFDSSGQVTYTAGT